MVVSTGTSVLSTLLPACSSWDLGTMGPRQTNGFILVRGRAWEVPSRCDGSVSLIRWLCPTLICADIISCRHSALDVSVEAEQPARAIYVPATLSRGESNTTSKSVTSSSRENGTHRHGLDVVAARG